LASFQLENPVDIKALSVHLLVINVFLPPSCKGNKTLNTYFHHSAAMYGCRTKNPLLTTILHQMNDMENKMNEAGEENLVFVNTQHCPHQCDTVTRTVI